MSAPFITDEQLEARLGNRANLKNDTEVEHRKKYDSSHINGRSPLTDGERKIIGTASKILGRNNASQLFGVNKQTAKQSECHADLQVAEKEKKIEDQVKEAAVGKLMSALNLLTPEKMNDASAKDLASIADRMAGVHDKMSPKTLVNGDRTLIIYA